MKDGSLFTRTWGEGDRVAVLLHGQAGDGRMWRQVGPLIAARGYRVIAVDLPGHGRSTADPAATLESAVDAVVGSVPLGPDLAIGHSLGGIVLAHAVVRLGARRAVYVDSPIRFDRELTGEQVAREYRQRRAARTVAGLRLTRPWWSEQDRALEADAATRWDVDTSVSLTQSLVGGDHLPPMSVPSLAILPEPSGQLTPQEVDLLRGRGVQVRSIPGAGHTVWYGFLDEFMTALSTLP